MADASQIRAARALLGWGQQDLVSRSGLSLTTIRRMEDDEIGPGRSSNDNVTAVLRVFAEAGIELIPENGGGAGVRRSKPAGK